MPVEQIPQLVEALISISGVLERLGVPGVISLLIVVTARGALPEKERIFCLMHPVMIALHGRFSRMETHRSRAGGRNVLSLSLSLSLSLNSHIFQVGA